MCKTNLWAADFEEVDGLSTDIHIIGNVSQKDWHTILHILWDQSVALYPEVFVYKDKKDYLLHNVLQFEAYTFIELWFW